MKTNFAVLFTSNKKVHEEPGKQSSLAIPLRNRISLFNRGDNERKLTEVGWIFAFTGSLFRQPLIIHCSGNKRNRCTRLFFTAYDITQLVLL